MKLVTSAQMRTLEERAVAAGVSLDDLMAAAGLAVAQEAWMQLGHLEGRRIAVLVGPGNNGGDGLVAARHLAEWGADVRCYALRPRDDAQWSQTVDSGIPCTSVADDQNFATLDDLLKGAELIVDALLGTGPQRLIEGDLEQILQRVAGARSRIPPAKLVAVDLPSGLNADTGEVDPSTVAPDETVTFHAPKVGLYTQPGAAFTGSIQAVEIGIPDGLDTDLAVELLERRDAKRLLRSRPNHGNKGTFGKVLVVAGSSRYPGAAILAASAPYRVGAGLVTLATPRPLIPALVGAMPEVTYLLLDDGAAAADAVEQICGDLRNFDALVVGCGLGQAPATIKTIRGLLAHPALSTLKGVVIDADGLNALAGSSWSEGVAAPFVVTPHPGEMARLVGSDVAAVQRDRLGLAQSRAAAWGGVVVLKGANTIIADVDGRARLSAIANSALATAGTGDVLAGAIGGLLAQGIAPFESACLGVYLHANAGERAARSVGTAGTTASNVLTQLALAGRALAGEEPIQATGAGFDLPGVGGAFSGLGAAAAADRDGQAPSGGADVLPS
jgi:NAD(P)H-hydrate epimerase